MKASSFLTALSVTAILAGGALGEAYAQLEVRLSVKVVLDANGMRPAGGTLSTDAGIRSSVDEANRLLATFGRGYQFRITEIVDLPGHTELIDLACEDASDSIDAGVILLGPSSYRWRTNAVNVYINQNAADSGSCAFNSLLVIKYTGEPGTFVHEGGHHLGLCHTQGCGCKTCAECPTIVDDGIDDTLPDRECWDEDQISFYSYAKLFIDLNATQQAAVSNTFNNVMSYHKPIQGSTKDVLTPGQWDKLADFTRRNRADVMNGKTVFVDRTNTVCAPLGFSQCPSGPLPTVASGVAFANAGDIVLIRRGRYNEPMTITKAVTFRATRGDAVIGKP